MAKLPKRAKPLPKDKSQGSLARDITMQQYERGWALYRTQHNLAQILTATGLTRYQLGWLIKTGDERRKMPSYQSRMAEESARIRERALEVADQVGKDAAQALQGSAQIAIASQALVRNILGAHVEWFVKPAIAEMKADGPTTDVLRKMAMPKELRDTVKVMRDYANFEPVARAWRTVFDSPGQISDPLNRGHMAKAKVDLSAETVMPASVAAIEELPGGEGDIDADPLDIMSEYKDMSLDEIEHYMSTGELPDRLYGDSYEAEVVAPSDADAPQP